MPKKYWIHWKTKNSDFELLYEDSLSLEEKIEKIAKEIYGADGVVYEPAAKKQIAKIESLGFGSFPVCMAKNQYSLSDDAKKISEDRTALTSTSAKYM